MVLRLEGQIGDPGLASVKGNMCSENALSRTRLEGERHLYNLGLIASICNQTLTSELMLGTIHLALTEYVTELLP